MDYLLDTSVAIYLRDREPSTLTRVAAHRGAPALSILTVIELEGGVVGTSPTIVNRRASLHAMLKNAIVLGFDYRMVQAYSTILRHAGFSRRRTIDRLIAATAIVHLTLVTINGDDFREITDLSLEVWPAPQ